MEYILVEDTKKGIIIIEKPSLHYLEIMNRLERAWRK